MASGAAVALHPEGVDRNAICAYFAVRFNVALHPEGVDRNKKKRRKRDQEGVALHPEGVDRNNWSAELIEIAYPVALHPEGVDRNPPRTARRGRLSKVALHPEGVDRNYRTQTHSRSSCRSPSTRRAWIEITQVIPGSRGARRRPPPGGRG